MPSQLNWTTDPGWLHFTHERNLVKKRFSKIAFVPGFVLVQEDDGIVRGRQARRVQGIEFDKKG